MSDAAAISGDFATYRHVQGRKVLQLVIEVPAELAATVFATLGTPGAGEGIPVALARLHSPAEPTAKPEAPKERRPFSELPYSQQAAMRCREPDFHKYCEITEPTVWADLVRRGATHDDAAAGLVRHWCWVASRTDIKKGTPAGDKWEALEAEYWVWQRGAR
jgi:hypothetical protein